MRSDHPSRRIEIARYLVSGRVLYQSIVSSSKLLCTPAYPKQLVFGCWMNGSNESFDTDFFTRKLKLNSEEVAHEIKRSRRVPFLFSAIALLDDRALIAALDDLRNQVRDEPLRNTEKQVIQARRIAVVQ